MSALQQQAVAAAAALRRLKRRRVPPEKRQRTEMSCDWCRRKKCKCRRPASTEPCQACLDTEQPCTTTEPRKRRMYSVLEEPVIAALGDAGQRGTTGSDPDGARQEIEPFHRRHVVSRTPSRPSVAEFLFQDGRGLPRYIGPIGSYALLVKLWEMMAARSTSVIQTRDNGQTMGHSIQSSKGDEFDINLPPREAADVLIEVFFSKVHADFPIFHRAIFQANYESMWSFQPNMDPAWLMSLFMVFVLGLEVASQAPNQADTLKERYLSRAKGMLPDVVSGASLCHVQALFLYSRYMHITRNRNGCWNIMGAAIRLAISIGLHRNGYFQCSPLERELRKRVWWTLYAFERMECSSLGRTSAINDNECNVGVPTEGMLDLGDCIPLGYEKVQSELMKILGSICKHQYELESLSHTEVDFAIKTMVTLESWYAKLPPHLGLNSDSPNTHARAILLLHVQYHYTVALLCRPFLICLSTERQPVCDTLGNLVHHAKQCISSAKAAIAVLEELLLIGLFNPKTCWDVYYIQSFGMILAMARFAYQEEVKDDPWLLDSLKVSVQILKECGQFSPTMQRFATVTTDFAEAIVTESDDGSPTRVEDQGGAYDEHPQATEEAPGDFLENFFIPSVSSLSRTNDSAPQLDLFGASEFWAGNISR